MSIETDLKKDGIEVIETLDTLKIGESLSSFNFSIS